MSLLSVSLATILSPSIPAELRSKPAAMGIPLGANDWAIPLQPRLLSRSGVMRDFTAGHISSEEGRALVVEAVPRIARRCILKPMNDGPAIGELSFHAGVS